MGRAGCRAGRAQGTRVRAHARGGGGAARPCARGCGATKTQRGGGHSDAGARVSVYVHEARKERALEQTKKRRVEKQIRYEMKARNRRGNK